MAEPRAETERSTLALLRRFWPLLRRDRRLAATAALLSLLTIPLGAVTPFLVKRLFDDALPQRDLGAVVRLGGLLLGLAATSAVVGYLQRVISVRLRGRVRFRVERRLFGHLLTLPTSYFTATDTGYLMTRVRDDVAALDALAPDRLALAGVQALKAAVFVVLLLVLDLGLALWGTVLVAVIFGSIALLSPALRARSRDARDAGSRESSALHEGLAGLETIRVAGRERAEARRYGVALADLVRSAARRDMLSRASESAVSLVSSTGVYLIVVVGAYRILVGASTVGSLFAFFLLLNQLVGATGSAFGLIPAAQGSLASLERIFALLDEPAEPGRRRRAGPRTPRQERARGEIELRGVSFRYPDSTAALHDVDLVVRSGEVVALVGRSGAGKSTLVRLLPRLHEPTTGTVLLDGRPLAEHDLDWLRRQVAFVAQDVFLFDRTIHENLLYARPEASDDEVRAAARAAYADRFIERLPDRYATAVGERGARLSGGEKQRLAIARALLRDPPILILDEATAALDSESERWVRKAIERLLAGRTCLVIAHRMSTIRNANRIVVLDAGRVVEQGSHSELLARDGLYRRLHDLQLAAAPAEEILSSERAVR